MLDYEILSYSLLFLMGLILGIFGAGGSLLTLPILIYCFHIPIVLATTYSLLIVGVTSLFGVVLNKSSIAYWKASFFALPTMFGVWISRYYFIPWLPDTFSFGSSVVFVKEKLLLWLLMLFMFISSYFMIRKAQPFEKIRKKGMEWLFVVLCIGVCLGIIMGMLGIGGGFLLIPTLALFLGLEMRQAIPTSLLIIFLNCMIGFVSDTTTLSQINYFQLIFCSVLALIGMWIGSYLGKSLPSAKLKRSFGVFMMGIAAVIAMKEFYF